jgi:hypothetical protein
MVEHPAFADVPAARRILIPPEEVRRAEGVRERESE